jgi:hypothetical protein
MAKVNKMSSYGKMEPEQRTGSVLSSEKETEETLSFGDIVPEGAGVLDSIVDMGDGLLEVNNSAVFYPGQRVSVYAKNWVLRGWVTIKEVSLVRTTEDKPVLIFDGPLPAGTCRGDRLVVEHAETTIQ